MIRQLIGRKGAALLGDAVPLSRQVVLSQMMGEWRYA
jgi:hypothetical protein